MLVGSEVSCKTLRAILLFLERKGAKPKDYLYGIDYDLSYLNNSSNRIDWSTLKQLLDNATDRCGCTQEDLVQMGKPN